MSLTFLILVVVAVCLAFAISYYVPWPPPIAFMRWLIPVLALVVVLILVLRQLGVA